MADYVRLKELVNGEFTVEEVYGFNWKMWDNEAKKMLVSESYEQGYRKIYGVKTDKGTMDISSSQIGSMYEACGHKGESKIVGRTFTVKSNGKDGLDIRYYINAKPMEKQESPAWEAQRARVDQKRVEQSGLDIALPEVSDEPIDMSDIPF